MDLAECNLLVTGANGFLGRHVVRAILDAHPGAYVSTPTSADADLRDPPTARALFDDCHPDVVWHLAARCGGIGANQRSPGTFIHDNLLMGVNVIEAARVCNVRRLVLVGTVCSYPGRAPTPLNEDDIWNGYPEETNAAYGIAKRTLMEMARAYSEQYGLSVARPILANLYGSGDNLDPVTSHVIPAMVRKFVEAVANGEDVVTLWGNGTAEREFLYVEDAARALVMCGSHAHAAEAPMNIGGGEPVTIAALAALVAGLCGFTGAIEWDITRPNGQKRRSLSNYRARDIIGFTPSVRLRDGLERTINWYRSSREARAA